MTKGRHSAFAFSSRHNGWWLIRWNGLYKRMTVGRHHHEWIGQVRGNKLQLMLIGQLSAVILRFLIFSYFIGFRFFRCSLESGSVGLSSSAAVDDERLLGTAVAIIRIRSSRRRLFLVRILLLAIPCWLLSSKVLYGLSLLLRRCTNMFPRFIRDAWNLLDDIIEALRLAIYMSASNWGKMLWSIDFKPEIVRKY